MAVSMNNSYKFLFRVSLSAFLVLTSLAAQNPNQKSSEPVVVTATLTAESGLFVRGLDQKAFEVFIDDEPAKILFARPENVPLSVGILFDASSSLRNPGSSKSVEAKTRELQRGLKDFIARSNPANEYFVMAFNDAPQLLRDWSSDAKAIVNALGGVRPTGTTALYDACYLAIDKVQHGRNPKRILFLITDGQDNNSSYGLKQVRDALRESNVMVYSVRVSNPQLVGGALEHEGKRVLNDLSAVSGGVSFPEGNGGYFQAKNFGWLFEHLALEFQNQYTISLEPGAVGTGADKWHKLKLKVTPPNKKMKLTTRIREGFFLYQR